MKTKILILCAMAALAGCSRQGGTGADQYRTTGSSTGTTDETTITNRNTNQAPKSQGGTGTGTSSDQSQSKGSQGSSTTPPSPGTQ